MFGRKLAPKGVKMCPGCPPKKIEPIVTPKFSMPLPQQEKTTRVVTVVNTKQYRNSGGKQNSLF